MAAALKTTSAKVLHVHYDYGIHELTRPESMRGNSVRGHGAEVVGAFLCTGPGIRIRAKDQQRLEHYRRTRVGAGGRDDPLRLTDLIINTGASELAPLTAGIIIIRGRRHDALSHHVWQSSWSRTLHLHTRQSTRTRPHPRYPSHRRWRLLYPWRMRASD